MIPIVQNRPRDQVPDYKRGPKVKQTFELNKRLINKGKQIYNYLANNCYKLR